MVGCEFEAVSEIRRSCRVGSGGFDVEVGRVELIEELDATANDMNGGFPWLDLNRNLELETLLSSAGHVPFFLSFPMTPSSRPCSFTASSTAFTIPASSTVSPITASSTVCPIPASSSESSIPASSTSFSPSRILWYTFSSPTKPSLDLEAGPSLHIRNGHPQIHGQPRVMIAAMRIARMGQTTRGCRATRSVSMYTGRQKESLVCVIRHSTLRRLYSVLPSKPWMWTMLKTAECSHKFVNVAKIPLICSVVRQIFTRVPCLLLGSAPSVELPSASTSPGEINESRYRSPCLMMV
mmetsp:Transcript_3605/g.5548  ORF Transcript_3605/g.5548 Transcript_3605/m.5548 type:complete len:295 (-) Transcript_3605:4094-4978(-)